MHVVIDRPLCRSCGRLMVEESPIEGGEDVWRCPAGCNGEDDWTPPSAPRRPLPRVA